MEYYAIVTSESLEHHGIKGQRWGIRRFQNEDGSLTDKGKKRISKLYKKYQLKGDEDLKNNYTRLYVDAYNKTADDMNNGGIDKFNKKQEKKYGKNYSKREGYVEDYNKDFDKYFKKYWNETISDFIDSNNNYNKAKTLVKKYSMLEWDEIAKSNSTYYDDVHKKK